MGNRTVKMFDYFLSALRNPILKGDGYVQIKEAYTLIKENLTEEEREDVQILELMEQIDLEIGKIEQMLDEVEETQNENGEKEADNVETTDRKILDERGMPKGHSLVTNYILDINGEKRLYKTTIQYYKEEMEDGSECSYESEIIEKDGEIRETIIRNFNGKEEKYIHIKNEQGETFTVQDENGIERPFDEKPKEGVKLSEHFMIQSGYSIDKNGKTVSQQNYENDRKVLDEATKNLLDEIYHRIESIDKDKDKEADIEQFMQGLREKIQEGYDLQDILKALEEYEKILRQEQEADRQGDNGEDRQGDNVEEMGDDDPFPGI